MFYQLLPAWLSALHNQFTNDYQKIKNTPLSIIVLAFSSPLAANVLSRTVYSASKIHAESAE